MLDLKNQILDLESKKVKKTQTFWALLQYCFLLSVAGTILSPTAFFTDAHRSRTRFVASLSESSTDGFSSRSMDTMHFQSYKQHIEYHQETIKYYSVQHVEKYDQKSRTILGAALWRNIQRAALPKHTDDQQENTSCRNPEKCAIKSSISDFCSIYSEIFKKKNNFLFQPKDISLEQKTHKWIGCYSIIIV